MGNYHDQIGTDSRPDLSFYSIDALPVKCFDSKILFDPFKEQFNLPPAFVIVCDLLDLTVGDISKQDNILIVFGIDQMNTSQGFRVTMFGLRSSQPDDLVALQAGRTIDWSGGFSIKPQILFGSNDKTTSTAVQVIQALVIQIGTIHNVDAASHDWNHIQNVDIVGATIGNMDKCGYSPL